MWLKFWEKIGEELGSRWATQPAGAAPGFLGRGAAGLDVAKRLGLGESFETRLAALEAPAAYLAVVVGRLLILAASSTLVTWLQLAHSPAAGRLLALFPALWVDQFGRRRS